MANSRIPDLTNYTTPDGTNDTIPIWDNANSQTKKITRNNYLGITGSPVGTTDSQSLTNKTINQTNTITQSDSVFIIQNLADATKKAKFDVSGVTTATTRTYTLPNASGTLVDLASAQTLTNKTLTSPVITGGSIDNTTVTVDAISGHTSANTGTIYGVAVTSSKISGASLTNSTVGPNQLGTGGAYAAVNTSETTTSTSYAQLTTKTDNVSVTIGANGLALVIYGADLANSVAAGASSIGVAMTGTNTETAGTNGNRTIAFDAPNNGFGHQEGGYLATGLTIGSTTFTLWYKVSANTGTFANRHISVIPL